MENTEMVNEIVSNDTVEYLTEAVVSNGNGMKTGLVIGGAMVAGAVLWDRVVKPVGRKVRAALIQRKAAKAAKAVKADSNAVDVDEIQPIK